MTPDEKEVLLAALAWWRSQRPLAWKLDDHLDNPTINTVNKREHRLAAAVARLMKGHRKSRARPR